MRIALAAGRHYGLACLNELIRQGHDIQVVFNLEEDEHESTSYYEAIELIASQRGIKTYPGSMLHDRQAVEILTQLSPDFMLVVNWRRLISKSVYSIPSKGCAVMHGSMLPKYRGFAPLNWVLINGETETGASLFFIADEVDSGPIIAQKRIPIRWNDTIGDVEAKMVDAYVSLLREALPVIDDGSVELQIQDELQASYCCSRTPDDGEIDWSWSAVEIYNSVRALTRPYPGAFTFFEGEKLIIWSADVMEHDDCYIGRIPGRVVRLERGLGVWILTGRGVIRIEEIELPDGKLRNASEVIRSVRVRLTRGIETPTKTIR